MRSFPSAILAATFLALTGCTHLGQLSYQPSAYGVMARAPQPLVAAVRAVDDRKEAANRLGTLLGLYGNPIAQLDTEQPVKDEVAKVFAQGLSARGEFAWGRGGRYVLWLAVHRFDADHYVRSQARIALDMAVVDVATGRTVYADAVSDQEVRMQLLGADTEDLRVLTQIVLNRSVDRLLDKPGFQAAMGLGAAPALPGTPGP